MKKLLFFLLILGAVQAKAQQIKGSIDLRDSTFTRSIPFEVASGSQSLKYHVTIYVTTGDASASLTDSHGKKYGGFKISTDGDNEPSKGDSSDSISQPAAGTWKFNIRANKATGRMSYQIDVIKP